MGLLRNIAKTITLFLFSLFLSLSILTFFLFNLTNYENAKTLFTTLFKEAVMRNETQKIEEFYNNMMNYCNLYQNQSVELPNNLSIKCSEILNTSLDYLLSSIAEKYFNQFYYKTYECEMPECIKEIKSGEDVVVLLSLKSHEFFGNVIKPLLMLTIVFGVLLSISIETWSGRLKTFGFEFLSIGIFYFFLPYFKRFISEKFLKEVPIGEKLLELIFNQFNTTLMIFFISGVILIGIWIFLKLFIKKSK